MEDTMLSGVYRRQRRDRRLLKRSFKAKVKRSMKRYTSELGPEIFLVLLLEKYCLDDSFAHDIFRWTNLDFKRSIDSLPCKGNSFNNSGIPLVYLGYIFLNTTFSFIEECWMFIPVL